MTEYRISPQCPNDEITNNSSVIHMHARSINIKNPKRSNIKRGDQFQGLVLTVVLYLGIHNERCLVVEHSYLVEDQCLNATALLCCTSRITIDRSVKR